MNDTYNEILSTLKSAFFEKTGETVDDYSDIGARFQAVASELFSLSCKCDFVLKQAFPQSATGEYLDFHSSLRDIERKPASKAHGILRFYINEASDSDIEINQGTICSVSGKPFVQFETDESAVISAGSLYADVPATAVFSGYDFNVSSGEVDVMVNPPAGVAGVTNNYEFVGGYDEESDSSLRKRILKSYSLPPTGFTLETLKEIILKDEAVVDCNLFFDNYELKCYVRGYKDELDDEAIDRLRASLYLVIAMGYVLSIVNVNRALVGMRISVNARFEEQLENEIRKMAKEWINSSKIGEDISLTRLEYEIEQLDGVEMCEIYSGSATGGIISGSRNIAYSIGLVEVSFYE